jgi:hypothetical protein
LLTPANGEPIPFTPEGRKIYEENKASAQKGKFGFDEAMERCASPGMPRIMLSPNQFKIFDRPGIVMFKFEWNRLYRRVDINEPSMNADDLQFTGRGIGHWDGDTLVIDATKIDETLLDAAGMPHSADLKVIERLRLLNDRTLEDRMRFEDPQTFRAPCDTVVTYRKLPKGTEVREDVCLHRIKTTRAIDEKKYLSYPK